MFRLFLLFGWAVVVVARDRVLDSNFRLTANQGFCSPGAYGRTTPAPGQAPNAKLWGSFCAGGADATTRSAESAAFVVPEDLSLYLAGYVSQAGLSLEIENLDSGARMAIVPVYLAMEHWTRYHVLLPVSWRGHRARFVARDDGKNAQGWFAFSEPILSAKTEPGVSDALSLLLRTVLHFSLAVLPALAIGSFAIRRGVRDLVLVGLLQLTSLGACAYISFWVWFAVRPLGDVFSLLLCLAAASWFGWTLWDLNLEARERLKQSLAPWAVAGAAALVILSSGFIYGGFEKPLRTAAHRFSHVLPPDNAIPYLFAEGVRSGSVPKPLIGDWHSSDRPPLQTGFVLAQRVFLPQPKELSYTILSGILQSFWIYTMWLLLTAWGLNARLISLAIAVCIFSGFVFLNTFYVWPKLLAATYTLGALIAFITPKSAFLASKSFCALVGALCAFGLLAHGGSMFAFLGAALAFIVLRKRMPFKSLGVLLLSACAVYAPWLAYQKLYDPPGNRLLKMHLGGINNIDPRPTFRAIQDAYEVLTPRHIVANKMANIKLLSQAFPTFWRRLAVALTSRYDADKTGYFANDIRGWMFHFFLVQLGFLVAGPLFLISGWRKQFRTREWRAAATILLFVALTLLAWCLIMFNPRSTVIHQGTYVTVLLAYIGSIVAIWPVSRLLAFVVAGLQITLEVLVYGVFTGRIDPHTALARHSMNLGCLTLCGVALVCLLFVLAKPGFGHPAGTEAPAE